MYHRHIYTIISSIHLPRDALPFFIYEKRNLFESKFRFFLKITLALKKVKKSPKKYP